MSFLNKIKLNYNVKLIDDYIEKEEFDNINNILKNFLIKDPFLFFGILKNLDSKNLYDVKFKNFYNDKKFVWINSFDPSDTCLLSDFLKFYLERIGHSTQVGVFGEKLLDLMVEKKYPNFNNIINFENMVQNSNFYQTLLLYSNLNDLPVLSSSSAFFETKNEPKKYLINHNSTHCLFFILNNPKMLFQRYKKELSSSQLAMNQLSNYDQKHYEIALNINSQEYKFYENRQSWNIHAKSWNDPNVQSAFRVKIIKYEDFMNNPEETFSSVLFHLKQHGLEIEINHDLVDEFIKSNSNEGPSKYENISNQERKSLLRDIDKNILEHFEFVI